MQQQQQEQQSTMAEVKSMFNLFTIVCDAVAFPVTICTTRLGTWGTRFLASPLTLLGVMWPWIFAAMYGPHPQLASLLLFWYASIVILLLHRIQSARLRKQGYRCHSRYWGDSWLQNGHTLRDQRRGRERAAILAFAVGLGCHLLLLKPLGAMFAIGAIAKWISDSLAFDAANARLRQMEDARIENDFYLEAYRDRNGLE